MNVFDWIMVLIMILLGFRGLARGFITEVFSAASPLLGLTFAIVFFKRLAAAIAPANPNRLFIEIGVFILIFIVVSIVIRLFSKSLSQGVDAASLGIVNKILGFALGVLEGLVAASIIILAIEALPKTLMMGFQPGRILEGSFFVKILTPIINPVINNVLNSIQALPAKATGQLP